MVTKEQILHATGHKLEDLAGRVLKEKSYGRDPNGIGHCIPLSWEVSMKWRDWAVKEYSKEQFHIAMWKVMGQFYDINLMIIAYAKPKHYIKAACLCKLNANPRKGEME